MDPNVAAVTKMMETRSAAALLEYGTDTTRTDYDLVAWLRELQAELMDGAIYIEAAIRRLDPLPE